MARGSYPFRPTQQHPMVVIPEPVYARIVIAAEEADTTPGKWVELALREGLKQHGLGMENGAFEAACRKAEADMTAYPVRHHFDQGRGRRFTDPK